MRRFLLLNFEGDIKKKYTGKNPMQAAKKAFTQIYKTSGSDEYSSIFSIQEEENENKTFTYEGKRIKVSREDERKKTGLNYKTTVKTFREKSEIKPKKDTPYKPPVADIERKIIPNNIKYG